MRKYQPTEVLQWKTAVRLEAASQLDPAFRPYDGVPLRLLVEYLFSPPKSLPKRDFRALSSGCLFYKTTRPDLADNLNKGLLDALTGIVWKDDSLIVEVYSRKLYTPRYECTRLRVEPLAQGVFDPDAWGRGLATSQRAPVSGPAERPAPSGKADCFGGEAPRSAPVVPHGKLPIQTPPRP